jgi:hypothetical protein
MDPDEPPPEPEPDAGTAEPSFYGLWPKLREFEAAPGEDLPN